MTAVIVDARRTAIGRAGGMFRTTRAECLAAPVIRTMLRDNGIAEQDVDEVIFGNAVGGGGNIAPPLPLIGSAPPALTRSWTESAGWRLAKHGSSSLAVWKVSARPRYDLSNSRMAAAIRHPIGKHDSVRVIMTILT